MDEGFPVKVHIYDISKGMARSLSYSFLGRQLDGIWHTGVVVHGQEFYFGSMGIECCQPCGTMLGQPDNISDLGSTQVPLDMFMDYLSELATSAFRPECYHLFDHNCNTFSNEVAQFLTGKCIPSNVTNLPAEVLSTPFGAMIKPFVDSMSVRPSGGHSVLPASASPAVAPPVEEKTDPPSSSCTHAAAKAPAEESFTSTPDPVVYLDKEVLSCFSSLKADLSKDLSASEQSLLDEISQYMLDANCQWSLSSLHISLLGDIIRRSNVSIVHRSTCSRILQLLVLKPGVIPVLSHDSAHTITRLLAAYNSLDPSIKLPILKMLSNCASLLPGHKLLTSEVTVSLEEPVTNCHLISDICVSGLIYEDSDMMLVTNSLVYNLSMFQVNDDLVVELSSAILQSLLKQKLEEAAYYGQCSLLKFMDANNQVSSLTSLFISDWDQIKSLSPRVSSICDKVRDRST